MRILNHAAGVGALVALTCVPATAQRGNAGNHGPATHVSPSHPTQPTHAGPTSGPTTRSNSSGPKASTPHSPDATASNHQSEHSPKKTTNTSTTNTGAVDFAATPVGQKLTRNTALQSRLTTELRALGYQGTVFDAAYGFKNLGQFVAAVNVSRNLDIPFDQLKLQMTALSVDANGHVTQSSTPTRSLGQAIHTLKPGADAESGARTATEEAETETDTEAGTKPTSPTPATNTSTRRTTQKKSS
jgi:hypothetical protein